MRRRSRMMCGPRGRARGGAVRKTVTVLFCDLVGSTGFQEAVDPEAARTAMARYHAMAQRTSVIRRWARATQERDWATVRELLAPDYVANVQQLLGPNALSGEGLVRWFESLEQQGMSMRVATPEIHAASEAGGVVWEEFEQVDADGFERDFVAQGPELLKRVVLFCLLFCFPFRLFLRQSLLLLFR